MFHSHSSDGSGPSIQVAGYFFAWFIGSIFAAYYAMRFTALRREAREKRKR